MKNIQDKVEEYIEAPDVPENSFECGWEYELIGQYASAMGFYLKCAELTDNEVLAYECLMRKAICFKKRQGGLRGLVIWRAWSCRRPEDARASMRTCASVRTVRCAQLIFQIFHDFTMRHFQ